MNIKILQHNEFSLFAVYVIDDFLTSEENLFVTEETKKCIQEDNSLSNKTNVFAEMSDWEALLKRQSLEFLFKRIAEISMIVYKLRAPNPNQPHELNFIDAWAMKHNKNDFTVNHIHGSTMFSGSYNCMVPSSEQFMFFPDFNNHVQLKSNQLMFFHGLAKHSVNRNPLEEPRYSIAFNMTINEDR